MHTDPQSLARQAGQLIFFGFDGYTVTPTRGAPSASYTWAM